MKEIFDHKIIALSNYSFTIGNLLLLTFLLVVSFVLLKTIKKYIINNSNLNESEKGRRISLYILTKYIIFCILGVLGLQLLGFELKILLAGSAALLVGLGFGLQGVFYDLISGIIILFERKIRVGDILEFKDKVGKVKSISLRTSVILTRDEEEIIIPNHHFIKDEIINTSYNSFLRRFRIEVCLEHHVDVTKVEEILKNAAIQQKDIVNDENYFPKVRLSKFDLKGLHFELLYYTKEVFRIGFLKSDLRFEILKKLREANIQFATDSFTVTIINSDTKIIN